VLPRFAVGMLLARKFIAASNPNDAIFTSRRGTWLSPNNVRRQWRQARAQTELGWVTPHTFRKTVATLIDREGRQAMSRASSVISLSGSTTGWTTTSSMPAFSIAAMRSDSSSRVPINASFSTRDATIRSRSYGSMRPR
jgi:hypothetical protein